MRASPRFTASAYLEEGGEGLGVVEHGVGDERVVGVDRGLFWLKARVAEASVSSVHPPPPHAQKGRPTL